MPPRAMWKGAISFGLVTIPVAVYPATEEKSLKFNQLHDQDMGRIRYKRVCSIDGEEVEFEHIVKGYEVEKDRYVVLTDEDLDAVPVESSRAIDIQQFVELEEIDPILFKKSYYLVPDETGAKAYALLRRALSEGGKVGIAKVSFRDKEHLAALRFKDDVFVLETMYWPDEVRAAEFDTLGAEERVRANEVEMAKSLIDSLTEPWNPEAFSDAYRQALIGIVEKKMAGVPIEVPTEEAPARVVDLMEALKASVAAAKERTPAASGGRKRAPAKKTTAKRATAKKPAAKGASRSSAGRKKAVGE
jgi:DNA end-binding protein Ku